MPSTQTASIFLPEPVSTAAGMADGLLISLSLAGAALLGLVALLVVFAVAAYRRRPGGPVALQDRGHLPTQIVVMGIGAGLAVGFFVYGAWARVELDVPPAGAVPILVKAEDGCSWTFSYPQGAEAKDVLHVPVDVPVKLVFQPSKAPYVMHAPAFRLAGMPSMTRERSIWFQATQVGEYPLLCSQPGQVGPEQISSKVRVESAQDYANFVEYGGLSPDQLPLPKLGKILFKSKTCATCHSLDGTRLVGPTFKGLFGRTETMSDGSTLVVDEAYVRESILQSQAKVVQGYPAGAMPLFNGLLAEREVNALVEYLKGQ